MEQKPLNPAQDFSEIYKHLFMSQMEHIRLSGAVPWQKAK